MAFFAVGFAPRWDRNSWETAFGNSSTRLNSRAPHPEVFVALASWLHVAFHCDPSTFQPRKQGVEMDEKGDL